VEAIGAAHHPRTRVLILNLPHNPPGRGDGPRLAALAELAQRHDLWVISDEVYGQIRYDGRRDSIAALPGMADRTVIVDGFSKGYSMTGWLLGYGVMPTSLTEAMTTSASTTFLHRRRSYSTPGSRRSRAAGRGHSHVAGLRTSAISWRGA